MGNNIRYSTFDICTLKNDDSRLFMVTDPNPIPNSDAIVVQSILDKAVNDSWTTIEFSGKCIMKKGDFRLTMLSQSISVNSLGKKLGHLGVECQAEFVRYSNERLGWPLDRQSLYKDKSSF